MSKRQRRADSEINSVVLLPSIKKKCGACLTLIVTTELVSCGLRISSTSFGVRTLFLVQSSAEGQKTRKGDSKRINRQKAKARKTQWQQNQGTVAYGVMDEFILFTVANRTCLADHYVKYKCDVLLCSDSGSRRVHIACAGMANWKRKRREKVEAEQSAVDLKSGQLHAHGISLVLRC